MTRPVTRLVGVACMVIGVIVLAAAWPWGVVRPVATPLFTAIERQSASIILSSTFVSPSMIPSDKLVPTQTHALLPTTSATRVPVPTVTLTRASASPTPFPLTRTPKPTTTRGVTTDVKVPLWQGRVRFGVSASADAITRYAVGQLVVGWYLNWGTSTNPPRPGGIEYAQMIRVKRGLLSPDTQTIATVARTLPGSLWLVGNEPDRIGLQDDATPVQYAQAYHQAYVALKQADPTALVAIAGVVQPTPLRLRYLDAVLEAYRQLYSVPMPVDVWNVHNFILREERGSWGAEIPPGLPDNLGVLREVNDNDNLDIFKSQIWAFRRWMRDRGQRDKPLIISEYGINMPPDYGFGPERVTRFMRGTFDFFLSVSDPELGYPPDGNRLVQRWCWYSLTDTEYPAGNLFDPQTGQMTPLGRAWQEYMAGK